MSLVMSYDELQTFFILVMLCCDICLHIWQHLANAVTTYMKLHCLATINLTSKCKSVLYFGRLV